MQKIFFKTWKDWQKVRSEPTKDDLEGQCESDAKTTKPYYSHEDWVPFAQDDGGNCLAVDLSPGPKGFIGQVITFGPDISTIWQMANSFYLFLEKINMCAALFKNDPDLAASYSFSSPRSID